MFIAFDVLNSIKIQKTFSTRRVLITLLEVKVLESNFFL